MDRSSIVEADRLLQITGRRTLDEGCSRFGRSDESKTIGASARLDLRIDAAAGRRDHADMTGSINRLAFALATVAAAGCGDSCFVAGTLVQTPDGPRRIESLVVGDIVCTCDIATGELFARPIVALHRDKVRSFRRVTFAGGQIGGLTESHPVYLPVRGAYVAVRDARPGDDVLVRTTAGLEQRTILAISGEETFKPCFEVYNLSVGGPEQNFFADGVLVHNKEPASCGAFSTFEIRTNVPAEALPAQTTRLSLAVTMVGPGEGSLTTVVVETVKGAPPTIGTPTSADGGKNWQCEITGLQRGGEYTVLPIVSVKACEGTGLNGTGRMFGGKLTIAAN